MDSLTFLVGATLAALVFAALGAWVASAKRRSEGEGCLLGCLLGPFGVIIEALLPTAPAPMPVAPPTSPDLTRKCPDCAETIKAEAHVCRFCGARFSDEEVAAAVARASEAERVQAGDVPHRDPKVCRYCVQDSRRNWYNSQARICKDCARRPDAQELLRSGRW